jgi:hypothetical protein
MSNAIEIEMHLYADRRKLYGNLFPPRPRRKVYDFYITL